MSVIATSLAATLKQSAHQDLKEDYPRIVVAGILAALGIHVGLLFGVLPGSTPTPFPLRAPDPPGLRQVVISYEVIPEAMPVPRPRVADTDFDEIVPDDVLVPTIDPTPLPPWSEKVSGPPKGVTNLAATYLATPEVPPEILRRVPPIYPELARMAGAEGRVVLEVWIDASGLVRDVQVGRSDVASTLERAAIEAVRQWLFVPAKQGGQPVAVRIHVPIEFRLH